MSKQNPAYTRPNKYKTKGRGIAFDLSLTRKEKESAERIHGKSGKQLEAAIRKRVKAMYAGSALSILMMCSTAFGQLVNPSLEGTPAIPGVLTGWHSCCYGSIPTDCADVLPFGMLMVSPADGSSYGGFATVFNNTGYEAWCQDIVMPPGGYSMIFYYYVYNVPFPNDCNIEVTLGNAMCGADTTIYSGIGIAGDPWTLHYPSWVTTETYTSICFRGHSPSGGPAYSAVDGIIFSMPLHLQPPQPDTTQVTPCPVRYFDLWGNEIESPSPGEIFIFESCGKRSKVIIQ